MAGNSIFIVTSPDDLTEIYKNTTTVSQRTFVRGMYTWMGIRPQIIEKMWETPSAGKSLSSSRGALPAFDMIKAYHRQQLHAGDNFEELMNQRIIPGLKNKLVWDEIKTHDSCIRSSDDSITFSFWEWCSEAVINGSTRAYFGKKIFEINPDLLKSNVAWERSSWKYVFKLPPFLSRDMINAKEEIVRTLREYFETPKEERTDALFFVGAVEDELRATGLNSDEIARVVMLHHWA